MGPLTAIGAAVPPSVAGQSEVLSRLTAPIMLPPPYYPKLRLVSALVVTGIFVVETVVRHWFGKKVAKIGLRYDDSVAAAILISLGLNPYLQSENFSIDWLVPEILAGGCLLFSLWRHLNDARRTGR